jgi:hypothetical protein
MATATKVKKVKCSCGKEVEVARLKTHLQRSITHFKGKGIVNNAMTAEELDALAKEILALNSKE